MPGERLKAWADRLREDVQEVRNKVRARVQFGDPPLAFGAEDLGVSPSIGLEAKAGRIARRRALLGLEYRKYDGPRR